jgi:uncharacterized protein (TIGR03437 family)
MHKNVVASGVICFLLAGVGLQAQPTQQAQQSVFVLPGPNSTASTVTVFSASPFSNITGFTAGAGAFQVLGTPDGSKFYVIANSGSSTVTIVSNSFTNPKSINLGAQATAAAISEDGKRVAVAAGALHLFDTSTDTDLLPNGVVLGAGVTATDVAASLDGKYFFALGSNTSGGSVLARVETSTGQVSASLPITGPSIAVAVGPNGLVYVSAPNQVIEVNPNTFTVTANGQSIGMNAKPGKAVFSTDGLYALVPNQTPTTGSAALLIGLSSHAVVNTVQPFQVIFDRLLTLNSTTFLAYASQNQSLYQITLATNGNLNVTGYSIPGVGTVNVSAAVFSNEVPIGGRSSPQYLFTTTPGTLYRTDVPSNSSSGQFPLAQPAGALAFAGAAITGTLPSTLVEYGNNQTIAPGGVSLPVVVRVLDNNGNPVSGITITFGTNNSAASVSPTSATTGTDGYALTYVTGQSTPGPLTVTATAGTQTVAYTMTVGSGSGGGTNAGVLKIIAGQGQMIRESSSTNAGAGTPLKVQATDASGNPVANAAVTFQVTQGNGGSITSAGQNAGSAVVNTDVSGYAQVDFLASILPLGTDFAQTTVTVSSPGTNSLNMYVTTVPITLSNSPTIRLIKPDQGSVLTGQAGTTLPDAVEVIVVSGHGQPIPNVGMVLSGNGDPTLPGATCADPMGTGVLTQISDPTKLGVATCDLVFNGKIGTANLTANVGYFQSTSNFTVRITPGPPGLIKIVQGNNQSGTPGQRVPFALLVQVSDAFGNLLGGVPVTWSVVTPGTVTLSSVSSATDASGNASALATLGNIAGTAQVKVTAGSASTTFTLTVNIPSAAIQKVSGDGQTTLISTAFTSPLVVKVVDASGSPVQGATVTFTVTSGSASLGSSSAPTGANGQASTNVTAGPNAGTIIVTAATSTFSTNFTLTSRLPGPTNVTFKNAASFLQGAVSPGEIVIISGNGIAPGVQGLVTAYNILGAPQPSLQGISVTFNGVTAPIFYVLTATGQPDQVVVQAPFETQPGSTANVLINSAGGGSGTFGIQVAPYAPGIFETTIGGQKYAVALRPDGSYISPSNPAHPGETILIYVAGLGQTTPLTATGNAGVPGQSVAGTLVVGVNNGGVPFTATYAPGMVGVYVIAIQIPSDTQTGPAQPIGVIAYDAAANTYFAQGSVIPIQ